MNEWRWPGNWGAPALGPRALSWDDCLIPLVYSSQVFKYPGERIGLTSLSGVSSCGYGTVSGSSGGWSWARSHCSLCLLEKEAPFHPVPVMGIQLKPHIKGESLREAAVLGVAVSWLPLLCVHLGEPAVLPLSSSSSRTQKQGSSPLFPWRPLQWNCLWWGKGSLGYVWPGRPSSGRVLALKKTAPSPATQKFFSLESSPDPDYPALSGECSTWGMQQKLLPWLLLCSLEFWFW